MENLSVVSITQAIIHCHSFMTYKIAWMGIIVCCNVWITHNTTVLVIWVIRWPKTLLPLIQTLLSRLATIWGSVSCQDLTDMLLFFSFWVPNDFKTEVHNLQFSGLKSQVEHQSILFIIQRDWVSIRVSFISKQVPIKQNANTLPFPKIGQHVAEKFCFMNQWILVIV